MSSAIETLWEMGLLPSGVGFMFTEWAKSQRRQDDYEQACEQLAAVAVEQAEKLRRLENRDADADVLIATQKDIIAAEKARADKAEAMLRLAWEEVGGDCYGDDINFGKWLANLARRTGETESEKTTPAHICGTCCHEWAGTCTFELALDRPAPPDQTCRYATSQWSMKPDPRRSQEKS